MHKPTVLHWQHVKRLLSYVKQTIHFRLLLRRQTTPVLRGFSDANWGGDLDDQKSTTVYIIFLGQYSYQLAHLEAKGSGSLIYGS